ncbi:hypothetical protein B0H12DRAFT_1239989 [Mycena haematopus]|nr:hypothetical protein B0H12DRAFT_1239989 [Mycena haematopus]
MTIHLPQELIDAILDHLAGDSDPFFMMNYSLVCRTWVPRNRLHSFETCRMNSRTISVFADLLRSEDCTFLPHVRNVYIDFRGLPPRFDDEFAANLRRLTGVRSLEMTLKIEAAQTMEEAFLRTAFPNITRLILTGLIALVPQLISTICLFPALQSLQIRLTRYPTWSYSATGSLMYTTPPPMLHSLSLCANTVGPILTWLHTAGHLPAIRSLKLPPMWAHEVSTLCAALQPLDMAFHLHHLDIPLTWLLRPFGSLLLFDLSLHPALHTLVLRDATHPYDMLPCITQLAAPSLECLVLYLDLPSYRRFNWAALDAFLHQSCRFQRLQSVVFIQIINYTDPGEDGFLREVLPMLAASGVLRTKWLRLLQDWCPP